MVSLASVLAMLVLKAGAPALLLPALCLVLGTLLGLMNGVLVTRLGLLPLIATLGTFYVYSGVAVALTGGAAQSGVPAFLLPWGQGVVCRGSPAVSHARSAIVSLRGSYPARHLLGTLDLWDGLQRAVRRAWSASRSTA